MARKYIFAIDETGKFAINSSEECFACGVLVSCNEKALKETYQNLYLKLGFPQPVPTTIKGLLEKNDLERYGDDDKARFHFNKLTTEQKLICKDLLLLHVEQIYVSSGKPSLYANNQNWWLISVLVVIRAFLKNTKFEPDSEIEIWIDNRNEKVWGILDEERPAFNKYHDLLLGQIKKNIQKYIPAKTSLKELRFLSDTSSFFINLADVTCGWVRKERALFKDKIQECPCQSFLDNIDPVLHVEKNPLMAFSLILQEMVNDDLTNLKYVQKVLVKLRCDEGNYQMAWDMFYDMLKYKIDERNRNSHLVNLRPFVECFKEELNRVGSKLANSKKLEVMVLINEYYSHVGDLDLPFERDKIISILQDFSVDAEGRILRKWEKWVSYLLRESQVKFNSYRFGEVRTDFEKLWDSQMCVVESMPSDVFGDNVKKDEPTTAILGTLAQSYAYEDRLEDAIEYFNLSKEYAIKTSNRTDSYLFNLYHRKQDIELCREAFLNQTGKTPEEYMQKEDFSKQWELLSYCKLCALELYKIGKTSLVIPFEYVKKSECTEYPNPLILKWVALALYLQNNTDNKEAIECLFKRAIDELLKEENGFAIKTLALPIIQCYGLINNQNFYHARYGNILQLLLKQSDGFRKYVESGSNLMDLKNEADIWQRAMLLPFIYS